MARRRKKKDNRLKKVNDKNDNRLRSRSGKSRLLSEGKAAHYTDEGTKRIINFGEFRRDSRGRWTYKPDTDPNNKSDNKDKPNKPEKKDPKFYQKGGRWDAIQDPELRRRRQLEEQGLSPELEDKFYEMLRLAFQNALHSDRQEEVTNSLANGDINSENIKYFISEEKRKELTKYLIEFVQNKNKENINSQPTVFRTSFPSCEI